MTYPTEEQLKAHKFYAFTCYPDGLGGRAVPIAIWNGVKDYEWMPPTAFMGALPGPQLIIIQANEETVSERIKGLSILVKTADAVIVWTKNKAVYDLASEQLKGMSAGHRQ